MNIGDLRQRQSLPLEMKIQKSIRTIEQFYDMYDGDIYISKGGVDSNIVEWLAKQSIYKDRIEGVCVASVEPVENIKHNFELGNLLLKSDISKKKVITDWGYPIISKEVAMKISRYVRTKHDWVKERRLKGYLGNNGKWMNDGRIPLKYQKLIYAPFELSEKCCDMTKKKPLKAYEKKTNKLCITGEMASESKDRQDQYLKHGCIMHDKKRVKCTPIGFWTSQDIMECVNTYKIKIPSIYGDVKQKNDGAYYFTGEQRTGCEICGFGIMFDTERFERLKKRKPNVYNEMMQGGKWIRKDLYRWVKFRPNSIPIWSNLYWVPSADGYGYMFVLNYFYQVMKIDKIIKIGVGEMNDNIELLKRIKQLELENKKLKKQLEESEKEQKHNSRGAGRKSRFTDEEQSNIIKMYTSKEKKIKELAEMYSCSVGLIHKLIHE